MRGAAGLGADIAGLVHDWNRAVAGVFDDLAFGDVDDGGSIAVAVPRHDAAGLDGELAEAELALLDVRRLLFEIDGGKHGVGHALARGGWPAEVCGLSVVRGAGCRQARLMRRPASTQP